MSTKPIGKMSFRHDVVDMRHQIVVYDATGKMFTKVDDRNFDSCFKAAENMMNLKIQDLIKNMDEPIDFRQLLKPAEKRGSGLMPIHPENWYKVTYSDFKNGFLGLITQSELARLRGVSRQAIHQTVHNGGIEFFLFQKQKYIPFDTIAPTLETGDLAIIPNVFYAEQIGPNRLRVRRDYKVQPEMLPFIKD